MNLTRLNSCCLTSGLLCCREVNSPFTPPGKDMRMFAFLLGCFKHPKPPKPRSQKDRKLWGRQISFSAAAVSESQC